MITAAVACVKKSWIYLCPETYQPSSTLSKILQVSFPRAILPFFACFLGSNELAFFYLLICDIRSILCSCTLSPTELIFGKKVDHKTIGFSIIKKLNFSFLYAKYYLNNKKLRHDELSVNEFIISQLQNVFSKNFRCRLDLNLSLEPFVLANKCKI